MDYYKAVTPETRASLIDDVRSFNPPLSSRGRDEGGALSIVGSFAAIMVGLFSYIISFGLLLTFGMVALLGFAVGFATLPAPGDVLFPSSNSAYVTPTPTRGIGSPSVSSSASSTSNSSGSAWDGARGFIRLIVFGSAFLALWPGWFGGYVVYSRLRGNATA